VGGLEQPAGRSVRLRYEGGSLSAVRVGQVGLPPPLFASAWRSSSVGRRSRVPRYRIGARPRRGQCGGDVSLRCCARHRGVGAIDAGHLQQGRSRRTPVNLEVDRNVRHRRPRRNGRESPLAERYTHRHAAAATIAGIDHERSRMAPAAIDATAHRNAPKVILSIRANAQLGAGALAGPPAPRVAVAFTEYARAI
jgi:hypothetical protein